MLNDLSYIVWYAIIYIVLVIYVLALSYLVIIVDFS